MGVLGLLSCCLHHQDQVVEKVDLVDIARGRQQGIEILVDYYCFQQLVMEKFWIGLSQMKQNPYLKLLGGEYSSIEKYINKLVQNLKILKINLVFFVDPSPGCSTDAFKQKIDTKMARHHQDMEKLHQIMDVCRSKTNMQDLHPSFSVRPVCLEIQIMHALRQCGCEIIQGLAGEADILIAQAFHQREQAYAIVSNDSDFCIFKDLRFIPHQLFDMDNNMQMGKPVDIPMKPEKLVCGIITSHRVLNLFKFHSHDMLVELSIVAGNDFTREIMRNGLLEQLDIRGRKGVENIAGWIRHYKNLENHHILAREMNHNGAFAMAVHHSRKFYNLSLPPDQPPRKGFFSEVLKEKIMQGKYPIQVLAMHNNLYWHRTMLEDTSYGHPCGEITLAELRAHIYRIVLPKHESLVNEYGRSPWEALRIAGVMTVDNPNIPSLNQIQEDKIFWNLKSFHHIISHQNSGLETMWFDRYGRKNGFLVYLLRYFLHQNWGYNLYLTQQEFLALVAMVFGRPNESEYQQICIRPTARCVTIGNWFQNLYRHAYLFLGKLLYLCHEFPLPHEVICGSAWTAFYMVCSDESFRAAVTQVPMQVLRKVQSDMNDIVREKKHMIRSLSEGVFYFDDRF